METKSHHESPVQAISQADLNENSLLAEACRATGLSDWGDDSFREPLRILLKSYREEAKLSPQGCMVIFRELTGYLANRLRIQEEIRQHPQINNESITSPVFIIGLPRSGTTLLQRLLACDPNNRPLLYWEAICPAPVPQIQDRETDPRINAAEQVIQGMHSLVPELAYIHPMGASQPDECIALLANTFVFPYFSTFSHLPSYGKWFKKQDMTKIYQYYRTELQLLQLFVKSKRWVLKCPFHLSSGQAILDVFPDALIIQTHRQPNKIIPSMCSLVSSGRKLYSDEVNPHQLGTTVLREWKGMLDQFMQVRDASDPGKFFDVTYKELVQDPIAVVRRAYEQFDLPWSQEFEEAMNLWLQAPPNKNSGTHHYTMEQYGLTKEEVDRQFASYCRRFAV